MGNQDIEYYMQLPYSIEIKPVPTDEGGGYMATIPVLGELAFAGDGDTPMEALKNLEEIKRDLFAGCLARGIKIPLPDPARMAA